MFYYSRFFWFHVSETAIQIFIIKSNDGFENLSLISIIFFVVFMLSIIITTNRLKTTLYEAKDIVSEFVKREEFGGVMNE